MPTIKELVLRAIGEARYEAEAIIEAVDEDWGGNVGTHDDEDEGLREGAVAGGRPMSVYERVLSACETARDISALARDAIVAKGLDEKACIKIADRIQTGADAIAMAPQRKGLAAVYVMPAEERLDGFIRVLREAVDDLFFKSEAELKAWLVPRADGDTTTLPNGEYSDLLDGKRRAETSLAACRAALQAVPEVGAVTLPDGEVAQIRVESYKALEAIWDALGNWPYERPASTRFDDPTGETSLESFVAATTTTSDVSASDLDDGGPVEPELDIDTLVAGVDVQASVDGRSVPVTVCFNIGGRTQTMTSKRSDVDALERALRNARNAGGIR